MRCVKFVWTIPCWTMRLLPAIVPTPPFVQCLHFATYILLVPPICTFLFNFLTTCCTALSGSWGQGQGIWGWWVWLPQRWWDRTARRGVWKEQPKGLHIQTQTLQLFLCLFLAQDKKMAGGYLKISDWFDHSCASQRDSYFTFFSEAFFLRFTVSCDFNRTCFSGELLKGVQLYVDCSGSVSGCGETAVIWNLRVASSGAD